MTVTLEPEVKAMLTRLSEALGLTRSACLNGLLKGMMGPLETMSVQMEQLQKLNQQQRDQLSIEISLIEQQALQHQAETADLAKSLTKLIHSAKFTEN